jgi:hypothetical protein
MKCWHLDLSTIIGNFVNILILVVAGNCIGIDMVVMRRKLRHWISIVAVVLSNPLLL